MKKVVTKNMKVETILPDWKVMMQSLLFKKQQSGYRSVVEHAFRGYEAKEN